MNYTQSLSEKLISKISGIVLILLSIFMLYPFIYVFLYSISDGVAAGATTITIYPIKPTLENYQAVFANRGIMNAFFISVSRTVTGAALHLMVTLSVAYALSKRRLVGRNKIMLYFVIPMYFTGGLLPFYVVVTKLHLLNNFLVYILPTAYGVFNMLLAKVFFEQLPAGIEEAAKIDGCSDLQVFIQIVLPSSLPIVATIAMFSGVAQWNSWFDAMVFVSKPNLQPLQTMLYRIILESQTTTIEQIMRLSSGKVSISSESIKMTTLMVSTVPIIIVYPFLQKYFLKGMMVGAIKG